MKRNQLLSAAVAAAFLLTGTWARANNNTNYASSWANIRSADNFYTDLYTTVTNSGACTVKYSTKTTGTGAGKAYLEFNFGAKPPNTNVSAKLVVFNNYNASAQHVNLYALDQAFPNMTNDLVWGSDATAIPAGAFAAQANDTNNNGSLMLTSGPYTASLVDDQIVATASNTVAFNLLAPWGQYVQNNKIVLVFVSTNDTSKGEYVAASAAGFRPLVVNTNLANLHPLPQLIYWDTNGVTPPDFRKNPTNQTVYYHHNSTNTCTVLDIHGSNVTVTAQSSDTSIVSSTNILITPVTGSSTTTDTNRTIKYFAKNAGRCSITLYAGNGASTNTTVFDVTVLPNPSITTPTNAITTNGVPTAALPFTLADVDVAATTLTVTAVSENTSVLAGGGIALAGYPTTNRTVTVTPNGQAGVATIALTASEANLTNTTTTRFAVMSVTPQLLFCDRFDYPPDPGTNRSQLSDGSANFWTQRLANSTRIHSTNSGALLNDTTAGEALIAPLANGGVPYGVGAVLYYSFKATWLSMPTNSDGEFLSLYDALPTDKYLGGKIYTGTNGSGNLTIFNLRVANQTSTTSLPAAPNTNNLTTNVTYTVVVRYNVDTPGALMDPTRLWVNPKLETDYSVTGPDAVSQGFPITHVQLNQRKGLGDCLIDNLKVGRTFNDVLPPILTPTITAFSVAGGTAQISFRTGPDDSALEFTVVGASTVNGAYSPAPGAVINSAGGGNFLATVPASGDQGFFRIRKNVPVFP